MRSSYSAAAQIHSLLWINFNDSGGPANKGETQSRSSGDGERLMSGWFNISMRQLGSSQWRSARLRFCTKRVIRVGPRQDWAWKQRLLLPDGGGGGQVYRLRGLAVCLSCRRWCRMALARMAQLPSPPSIHGARASPAPVSPQFRSRSLCEKSVLRLNK